MKYKCIAVHAQITCLAKMCHASGIWSCRKDVGAIGLVESVEWSLASSSLTVLVCMLYNNKHFEKPAKSSISLPCALLKSKEHPYECRQTQLCCWSPRVCFTYVSAVPCFSLGHAHWRWRSVSSDFSCPRWLWIQALLLHSGVPAHFAWFAVASSSWVLWHRGVISTNSKGLEWGVWCSWRPLGQCQPLELFLWQGCPYQQS